jgi:hypothetical protein
MTTVAQVGAFRRFSEGDSWRWVKTTAWLMEVRSELLLGATQDVVNLRYGRDFLRERRKYDIVVLHSPIAFPNPKEVSPGILKRYGVSPLTSLDRWRRRLERTEAEFIFVIEAFLPMCVSAWNLGELNGYQLVTRDSQWGIYANRTRKAQDRV